MLAMKRNKVMQILYVCRAPDEAVDWKPPCDVAWLKGPVCPRLAGESASIGII